jgi:hypothetical protein
MQNKNSKLIAGIVILAIIIVVAVLFVGKSTKTYSNNDLGFSFKYPKEFEVKTFTNSDTGESMPFITKGDKGEAFFSFIYFPDFYFTGDTKDYVQGRDAMPGESGKENCAAHSNKTTSSGVAYRYEILPKNEIQESDYYTAFFNLNDEKFPCLGFAGKKGFVTEEDFLKVTDSLRLL